MEIILEKPGFIHITKTGGACIKNTIMQSYKDYFLLDGFYNEYHDLDTSYFENPFAIIRDPVDRFFSLYYYWKNGSEIFKEKLPDYTISDFIYFLKIDDCALNTSRTWISFFKPQSEWIKEEDYKKTVILIYKKNLNQTFDQLLNYYNIPIRNELSEFNVTKNKSDKLGVYLFAKNLNEFIQTKYQSDFDLYDKALNNPELFRKVIL